MFRIALCQMKGSFDKEQSKRTAEQYIRRAAAGGADIVSLPEMWNCPYSNEYFREYAETTEGETVKFMAQLAAELGIYIIGGSIPELHDSKIYNTCFCFDRYGNIIGKHRKVHLFDIDVEGGIRFMESDTLTAGNSMTVIDTEFCKIGVAICYDVRFPEWFRKMTVKGAKIVFLPAAFNTTTGPVHWSLTMRARALDNQIYFAANSPARDENGPYQAYGHSCVVDPWGKIVAEADENEDIIYWDVDLEYVESIRNQLPLLKHRREELY